MPESFVVLLPVPLRRSPKSVAPAPLQCVHMCPFGMEYGKLPVRPGFCGFAFRRSLMGTGPCLALFVQGHGSIVQLALGLFRAHGAHQERDELLQDMSNSFCNVRGCAAKRVVAARAPSALYTPCNGHLLHTHRPGCVLLQQAMS